MRSPIRGLGLKRRRAADSAATLIAKADLARDAKDWTLAAIAYAEALTITPERADIWVQYGHALKESRRLDEAEAAYRRALAIQPDLADTHLQLGHLLKLSGRKEQAARAYMSAASLDLNEFDAVSELDTLVREGLVLPPELLASALSGPFSADRAATPDDDLVAARAALDRLIRSERLDADGAAALQAALDVIRSRLSAQRPLAEVDGDAAQAMVFDIADLLAYFRNSRLPTGIQRVQIEVIRALLRAETRAHPVQVCSFGELQDDWVEIPSGLFLRLCELSLASGDVTAPDWQALTAKLDLYLRTAPPFEFPQYANLINLGTSWWLQNYFLNIRRVKRRWNVKYIPFVHDFIPIQTPEHCIRELTQDFISWTLGVFHHADMFLVNSEATKRDLLRVADTLGRPLDQAQAHVVRLDADFRRPNVVASGAAALRKWRLTPGGFVLFVSTIESRKNHLGAFSAWLSLIRKHGAAATPQLVCVGNAGWLNDAVHAKLASSDELRAKVTMLSRLSDDDLAGLYQNCLFTLYPSHYEGWGLPVTESLSHGKVALISDASSLPEAGGDFAEYFRAGSDADLAAAAERLIFNPTHRLAKEQRIQADFRPRRWSEIGQQIGETVSRSLVGNAGKRAQAGFDGVAAELGVYYPITRNFELRIWKGMVSGEMFRSGAGWWWPDDWGVWTRPSGGELMIRIKGPHLGLRGYFRIAGLIDEATRWTFEVASPLPTSKQSGVLRPAERRWVVVDLPAAQTDTNIIATLAGEQTQDLASRTGGLDRRVTSVGLEGFYVCERDDLASRLALAEALALHDLDPLTPGYGARPC
jgi:glycosyltransferase involved in cell wall biosynthesis